MNEPNNRESIILEQYYRYLCEGGTIVIPELLEILEQALERGQLSLEPRRASAANATLEQPSILMGLIYQLRQKLHLLVSLIKPTSRVGVGEAYLNAETIGTSVHHDPLYEISELVQKLRLYLTQLIGLAKKNRRDPRPLLAYQEQLAELFNVHDMALQLAASGANPQSFLHARCRLLDCMETEIRCRFL